MHTDGAENGTGTPDERQWVVHLTRQMWPISIGGNFDSWGPWSSAGASRPNAGTKEYICFYLSCHCIPLGKIYPESGTWSSLIWGGNILERLLSFPQYILQWKPQKQSEYGLINNASAKLLFFGLWPPRTSGAYCFVGRRNWLSEPKSQNLCYSGTT